MSHCFLARGCELLSKLKDSYEIQWSAKSATRVHGFVSESSGYNVSSPRGDALSAASAAYKLLLPQPIRRSAYQAQGLALPRLTRSTMEVIKYDIIIAR